MTSEGGGAAPARQGRRTLGALLGAEVISITGSAVTAVALPWFVLITSGSPARMGLVMAAEFAGTVALGLPSGGVVDRLGPRRAMLIGDLARAALVALIPFLSTEGLLSFPLLLVLVFAVGAFFAPYSASQQLVLVDVVGEDEAGLTRAGGLLGSMDEAASLVGPAVGGLLIALFGPRTVLYVDAVSYLTAFSLVLRFVPAAARAERDPEERHGALAGLRFLARDRTLGRMTAAIAVNELAWTGMMAALPVLASRHFHAGARLAGWFVAADGGGSMVGGLLAARLAGRTGGGRPLRLAAWAFVTGAATLWILATPLPAWAVGVTVAAYGVCIGLVFPPLMAALTVRTPPSLRPQVMTSANTAFSATGPLGFVGVGLLLSTVGPVWPALVAIAVAATVASALFASGALRPDPPPASPDRPRAAAPADGASATGAG